MKQILIFVAVIIILVVGGFFLQNKNNLEKVQNIITRATPTPTPTPEIDPSSLTWTQTKTNAEGWPKRDSHSVFVFDNKMWVLGGLDADSSKIAGVPDYESAIYYNDIWNTSDGVNWTRVVEHADFPYIRSASVVNFKGVLYMYGGWSPHDGLEYKNGIWSSTDGIHWKKVVEKPEYPEREGQIVLEWNGKLWLVAGVDYFGRKTFNDVWSSDDGIHWTAATTDAPWHSRWDHALGVWNGKMYIAGGMNFHGVGYSDEWVSSDGAHWDLVSPNAAWGERQGQEIVNYHGYMWLISGLHSASNEGKGDAWYSTDGIEWKKASDDYQWKGREDHGVIVFNDKIWVMGGMDSDWHWNGDVWSSGFLPMFSAPREKISPTPSPEPTVDLSKPDVSALEYFSILLDAQGKQTILAEKNKNMPVPIASITKLMTAVIASEELPADRNITVPASALAGKGSAGEIKAGETFSLNDLLSILLLPSDNDTAELLAQTVGEEKFINLMNKKAQEIGMTHTKYVNAMGLDNGTAIDSNQSTAEDLSKLAIYIIKNHPKILAITGTKEKTVSDTAGIQHTLKSTNHMFDIKMAVDVLGGKTGETPLAKKNLVLITNGFSPQSSSPDDRMISVVLHSDDNFFDMQKLIFWIVSNWKK
ncbi:MAG: serine hydrolase [Candidatus Pacebacteria bacterium]|nr:serine hydrolase [Candidatus Paceibacterota bacterium]